MPLLTIHHKTEYRYTRPVAFGEHRIMLRPRDGHDLRVLDSRLEISPEPMSLHWIHDVFGNSVAIANFDERAAALVFDWHVTVEHNPVEEFELTPDDSAYFYPFAYSYCVTREGASSAGCNKDSVRGSGRWQRSVFAASSQSSSGCDVRVAAAEPLGR
jgi:transglutaminase-like putative cysteine protease